MALTGKHAKRQAARGAGDGQETGGVCAKGATECGESLISARPPPPQLDDVLFFLVLYQQDGNAVSHGVFLNWGNRREGMH